MTTMFKIDALRAATLAGAVALLAACGGGGSPATAGASGDTEDGRKSALALTLLEMAPPVLRAEAAGRTVTYSWNATAGTRYDLVLSTSPDCDAAQPASCPGGQLLADVLPPYRVEGLSEDTLQYARVVAQSGSTRRASAATVAMPVALALNGAVASSTTAPDGTTYLGGTFTLAGVVSGQGVVLDAASGLLRRPDQATVAGGAVLAAVADGAGGWYLGGSFQRIGGANVRHLAHVFADGRLDTAFDPAVNGPVRALALMGGTLYVGGAFTQVAGQQRVGLAALTGGGTLTAWNPNPGNGVFALAAAGGVVYASGSFVTVGAQARPGLAAIDINGNLLPWNPRPEGAVFAIAVAGTQVYLGGNFTGVAGERRDCLAAVGTDGVLRPWNPVIGDCPGALVFGLAAANGQVYVGGRFARVGIAGVARASLAAFDAAGQPLASWNPGSDGEVYAVGVAPAAAGMPQRVLVGGRFDQLGAQARYNVGAIDLQGRLLPWAPNAIDRVQALAANAADIYVGGDFTALRAQPRRGLAAMDSQGALTSWSPAVDGVVYTLALQGDVLYLAGQLTRVAGVPRGNTAAVGRDGSLKDWHAPTDGPVLALAPGAQRLYLGGQFTQVSGQPRRNLAAVGYGGALVLWTPDADGTVHALAAQPASVFGERLYVGGSFDRLNGQLRRRIGAYTDLGDLAAWNPHGGESATPGSAVHALQLDGAVLYAGGNFNRIGTFGRPGLAAIQSASGEVLPWAPRANGAVHALQVVGGRVYAGGEFTQIGIGNQNPVTRRGAAAIGSDGTLDAWDPDIDGTVYTLAHAAGRIVPGGMFGSVTGGKVAGNVAALLP